MIGKIARIFPQGYGFIKTEEGDEFFFHVSGCKGIEWKELLAKCPPGTTDGPLVFFKEQEHPRGPRAYNVELIPDV
jgi:cold shock CspA family protein